MFKLIIRTDGGRISGSLTKPRDLRIDRDGAAARTGGVEITMPIQKAALKPGRLQLTIDGDDLIVTTEKYGALLMRMEGIQPLETWASATARRRCGFLVRIMDPA